MNFSFEEAQALANELKEQALNGQGTQQEHPQSHPGDDEEE